MHVETKYHQSYPAPELSQPRFSIYLPDGYVREDCSGTFYWDMNGEDWGRTLRIRVVRLDGRRSYELADIL